MRLSGSIINMNKYKEVKAILNILLKNGAVWKGFWVLKCLKKAPKNPKCYKRGGKPFGRLTCLLISNCEWGPKISSGPTLEARKMNNVTHRVLPWTTSFRQSTWYGALGQFLSSLSPPGLVRFQSHWLATFWCSDCLLTWCIPDQSFLIGSIPLVGSFSSQGLGYWYRLMG